MDFLNFKGKFTRLTMNFWK